MTRALQVGPSAGARDLRVVVIGAGMSGILAGIKLKEAGVHNLTIYEKAAQLGGTWRDNTYPGLACDVPSHHYAYSFELNPEWSQFFSPGAEIHAYFEKVAAKHQLQKLIRFNQEIVRADFQQGRWVLTTRSGLQDSADVVIAATGVLHHPVFPAIDGREHFAGASFHSARWDHGVPMAGRRVGVIGTGSTGIQIVPALVPEVQRLTLFQRTPQWILPLPNTPYSEEERNVFRNSHQRMRETYEFWGKRFQNTFARAVIGDREQMQRLEELCKANLQNIKDPLLRYQLTPDYQVACKRLIMSDTFYPAIQQPVARLVTQPIEKIEAGGVRTVDGELHALDVLVYATGFDGHAFMRPMEIVGPRGVSLNEAWAAGNEAYRSVAIPGFPNFFTLVGPNSPIGNFSLILIAELQFNYIQQLIAPLREGECRTIEPSAEATQRFNLAVKEAMKKTVWVTGCRSWYQDKQGNAAMWPWSFERFEREMRHPEMADFVFTS